MFLKPRRIARASTAFRAMSAQAPEHVNRRNLLFFKKGDFLPFLIPNDFIMLQKAIVFRLAHAPAAPTATRSATRPGKPPANHQ